MAGNIRDSHGARFHDLARPVLRIRHASATVRLLEWRCGGHTGDRPAEEWNERYEVVVPRRGAFEWEIAGRRTLADPGTATFLHPAESYRVRHPVAGGDEGLVFALSAAGVRALLATHDPAAAERAAPRFPRSVVPLDGPTYLLQRLALRAARQAGAMSLEVEERTATFLAAVVTQAYGERRGGSLRLSRRAAEYAGRVAEIVAARYREPLTLAAIAAEVGVSPYHLSRLVTATGGVPIHRMVLRRRLRDALELVLETRETLGRIAMTVGFASHSHLTDAFRCEFGVTPRALRVPRRQTGSRPSPP